MPWMGKVVECNDCNCQMEIDNNEDVEVCYEKKLVPEYGEHTGYLGEFVEVTKKIKVKCPNCKRDIIINEEFIAKGLSKEAAEKYQ